MQFTLLPGSNNALRLLLNVEQYEIMRGPQIDAGVKVHNFFSITAKIKSLNNS